MQEIQNGRQELAALFPAGSPPAAELVAALRRLHALWSAGRCWEHLEEREHPWRKQLYVKGRNMPAGLLVRRAVAEGMTVEEAAEDYGLPADAVREAIAYSARHADLLEQEGRFERHLTELRGLAGAAADLPG